MIIFENNEPLSCVAISEIAVLPRLELHAAKCVYGYANFATHRRIKPSLAGQRDWRLDVSFAHFSLDNSKGLGDK